MNTYLLDELTIGHIGKTIRVTDGKDHHQGELLNFDTQYESTKLFYGSAARKAISKGAILYFENGMWYANMSETFKVIEGD